MKKFNFKELIKTYDNSGMYDAIRSFPEQILYSVDQMKNWKPVNQINDIRNILVLGMGGSAIGGDIVKVITQNDCKVPIIINRSYTIPKWVNNHTLVIASSYSGNTEETLSGYDLAKRKDAQIIAMTTGGKLADLAKSSNFDVIPMVPGLQPRAALGYSFTILLGIFTQLGFLSVEYFQHLIKAADSLTHFSKSISDFQSANPALDISTKLYQSIPVIYGSEDTTWVAALRMRGQLAENSKMMAFHHHIPEQNHNEIEGWGSYPELLEKFKIVWLSDISDHPRSIARMRITKNLLDGIPGEQVKLEIDGSTRLIRLLKLIHLIDWISYYLALINLVDPSPVNRIMKLKSRMSEV